jgi:hypothetical protein
MSSKDWSININDAFGTRLLVPTDWESFDLVKAEMNVGVIHLVLPGHYEESWFSKDRQVEIHHSLPTRPDYLFLDQLWLMRDWMLTDQDGPERWVITAFDLNYLLADPGRVVDYAAASAEAAKTDFADDMQKAIVRENLGTLATDTTRDWSTYLAVQADLSAAPSVTKRFAHRGVLRVLQDLAQASRENGTYLTFDMPCTVQPSSGTTFQMEFRTYTGQRGVDHRFPNGSPPVLIGPEFGNLINFRLAYSAANEVTRAIVGGQGTEAARLYARASDAARIGESPFGLREAFYDSFQDSTTPTNEAEALLKAGKPTRRLTGTLSPTSGLVFDLHVGFGDFITAQVKGQSFDAHLDQVQLKVAREGGEQFDISVRAE